MKIEPAPRPVNDTSRDGWRKLITNSLPEGERHDFEARHFVPCFTCSSAPGAASLCRGCLANLQTITELRETQAELLRVQDVLTKVRAERDELKKAAAILTTTIEGEHYPRVDRRGPSGAYILMGCKCGFETTSEDVLINHFATQRVLENLGTAPESWHGDDCPYANTRKSGTRPSDCVCGPVDRKTGVDPHPHPIKRAGRIGDKWIYVCKCGAAGDWAQMTADANTDKTHPHADILRIALAS